MESLPVTERSNPITANIDVAETSEMIRMLYEADLEIFNEGTDGLLGEPNLNSLRGISASISHMLSNKKSRSCVVLSGCGTSGRLAFMCAMKYNKLLRDLHYFLPEPEPFRYLIAGDDKALFTSQELIEDNPFIGRNQLKQITEDMDSVLYIGITCGLSAAYVAGQLDLCLEQPEKFTPVLVGFNPLSLARNNPVENWNKTFRDVTNALSAAADAGKAFILTPIIGPEPITGSTRMKSGSATKILLDSLFFSAFYATFVNQQKTPIEECLKDFWDVDKMAYQPKTFLSHLIDQAGSTINGNGHVYYISGETALGLVALVDASECTPTFGCDDETVRGFIEGGYNALAIKDPVATDFKQIDLEHFQKNVLPLEIENDYFVFLVRDEKPSKLTNEIRELVQAKGAAYVGINFTSNVVELDPEINHHSGLNLAGQLQLPSSATRLQQLLDSAVQTIQSQQQQNAPVLNAIGSDIQQNIAVAAAAELLSVLWTTTKLELLCKLTCNMLTTGAFIRNGKVCDNFMVDLKIRNNKLFHRAVRIVEKFSGKDSGAARTYLLRSIYETDQITTDIEEANISQHIIAATSKHKVVPLAIVMASSDCKLSEARAQLQNCPIIKSAIAATVKLRD